MEFQIRLNYHSRGRGYIYFKTSNTLPQAALEDLAIKEVHKYQSSLNPALYLSTPPRPAPTIEVVEYKNKRKISKGVAFKCKWR